LGYKYLAANAAMSLVAFPTGPIYKTIPMSQASPDQKPEVHLID